MVFISLKYSTNRIKVYSVLLIIILFLPIKSALSQIPYETSKALLIYQFAKNTKHDKHKNIKKYKIGFLANDFRTYEELKKITQNNEINAKPISLSKIKSISKIGKIQLLYVDKTWAKRIDEIWPKIENKNILLISEQCADPKYIMLNILFNKEHENISFEINKANIIIENFSINPELLLLGGKEIDIRELYREMKQRLKNEEKAVIKYKSELKKQTKELGILRKEANDLNTQITILFDKITISEGNLAYLTDSIKIQQSVFLEKVSQIKDQETKLKNFKDEIRNKEYEIEKVSYDLSNILSEKRKQKEIIDEQKSTLSDKEEVISTKNRQLTFSSILAFMLIILAIVVYYALNVRKKANKKQLLVNHKLKKALQKLTDTQSQLIQSEKMASLGVLTAGIAHEINNPVNYINSGLEGLKTVSTQIVNVVTDYQSFENSNKDNKKPKPNLKEELSILAEGVQTLTANIQNGVHRTSEIIKSLNTFSRADNDALSLSDLHDNINSTITLLHNEYKNRIEILKNYGDIPKTYCYSGKLNQVFMNILSNAIQAIPNKGKIVITSVYIKKAGAYQNGSIKITIKDDGPGIPQDIQTRIYEPFFTTKQVGQGTGLGLSITHGIIEQHNGSIKLKSDSKGTEFEIIIPVILQKS